MHVKRVARLIVSSLVAALLLAACGGSTEGKFGAELYDQVCASCHGDVGQGTPGRPAIGAGSDAVELSDIQLEGVMRIGPGAMPNFSRLSDEQIQSLVDHLRALQSGSSVQD